ncbi:MAG: terminase large subunit [Phage AS32]|nr:MAG: terminase large subunit [Phage AS32]
MLFDPARAALELQWLKDHPWFDEMPASMPEFLGEAYLNIEKGIRVGVRDELIELFGAEVNGHRIAKYRWAMFTGAIGIGKTTMASIILPYMCHWTLCLKDPQDFYDLLPGSRIAFMQMSTSEEQAKETLFGDIKARIEYSPWFQRNYKFDPNFKNQIRFPKEIWVLPGNSAETTFEGYNILGGVLDEADSHKVTKEKDYAEQGWDTINSRIDSRFDDKGFLITVGQMKKANGFASKKYEELKRDPENAHTVRMTIWESRGWDHPQYKDKNGNRDSFWYDTKRKEIVPTGAAKLIATGSENLLEIPSVYRKSFENKPEKALRDLAGIPPAAGDAFISLTYKIEEAVERWQERYDNIGSPVTSDPVRPMFEKWFKAQDSLRRAMHVDIAYSSEGDALGLAMGHVSEVVDWEGEVKPYIVFDFLMRIKAAPGTEIMLQDVRRIIYDLKEDMGFKISKVTMDGFESTEMKQQLRKRKFHTEKVSVDKSRLPYEDLRDAIYEDRIEFPPYMTYIEKGSDSQVEIAVKELSELEDQEKKIDHPANGSKDVADAMAGVVFTLMGNRIYRRNLSSIEQARERRENLESGAESIAVGSHLMPGGLKAPVPPRLQQGPGGFAMPVPTRLMPKQR